MAKRLFLLLICSLIGGNFGLINLSAMDEVQVTRLDASDFVETVLPPEPELEQKSEAAKTNINTANAVTVSAPAAGRATPQIVNYTVTTYIGSRQAYIDTAYSLSYSDIYRYQKMVYGHNSDALLGNLIYRRAGEVFTITENGAAQQYRVAEVVIYNKTDDGYLENNPSLMNNIAYSALGHDVALLTCHGEGAKQRLVVLADAV